MAVWHKRGTRRIVSIESEPDGGPGFVWTLDCGHTMKRPHRSLGRERAVCPACRATTPAASEGGTSAMSNADAVKRMRDFRISKGICRYCPKPAEPGRTMCVKHLERNRLRVSAERQK